MKRYTFNIIILASTLFFISCKKYVEIPPPQNQLVSELVFSDDKTANATLAGLYTSYNGYNGQFANVNGSFFPAMGADEFYYAFSVSDYDEFKDADLSIGNGKVNSFWEAPYALIYHANAILEGLEKSTGVSEAAKRQFRGEAKFLRAFNYFYLVNYFGDVPLILNTDYKVNTLLPRENKDKVWESIVKDLLDAQADLSDEYIDGARTRANKSAATALLARTYLYLQQWDKAEAEATKVINDSQYELLDDLNTVFLKNSREAVWQLESVNKSTKGVNTWEGFSIVPATPTGRAYYNLYDELVNAFEPGDERKNSWTKTYVTGGKTFYFPYKYKIRTADVVQEYSMVIRFAELYLIRAEARTAQNNLDGAKEDLDEIRGRALLGDLDDDLSKPQMEQAVAQERRIELFAEWGHRWFDLRRTGKSLEVLGPLKPELAATDLYYPIPLSAMKTNPYLVQNDGYHP